MPNRRKTHKVKTPWLLRQRQRQRQRLQTQKGGRFVGAGTYGCGFRPALRCEGEATRRRGKFAKLVARTTAADELILRTILFPRDPERQYFLYPEAICEPAPFEGSDEAHKCHLKFTAENPAHVVIMGKGGKDLQVLTLRPHEYVPFFKSLRNVFHGLARLNTDGLAHMDIKPANIVTRKHEDGSFHTRLIDFGLMIDPTRLDAWAAMPNGTFNEYIVFHSNYLYWPFEVRLLNPTLFDQAVTGSFETVQSLRHFYNEVGTERNSVPYKAFSGRKLTRVNVAAMAAPLAAMPPVPRYAAIIAHTDVYGLGVSLSQIYYRFTGHSDIGGIVGPVIAIKTAPGVKELTPLAGLAPSAVLTAEMIAWHRSLAERVSIPLYMLVRNMTHPEPGHRPTLEEALVVYEGLLSRMDEELTADNITMAVKSWMLNAGALIEGVAVGGAGAAAAAASSSSEVPPSPEYVPLLHPPVIAAPPRSLLQPPVIAAPPRSLLKPPVIAAPSRSAVMPIPVVSRMASYVSSDAGSVPELIPKRNEGVLSVSSSSKNNSNYENYNSSEDRYAYERYLNDRLNYNGW